LKEFYNSKIKDIKNELKSLIESISDKVMKIKLTEVNNIITELPKEASIKNDDIVNLLQYYQLLEEIKSVN
jgi:hypothetical protein